MSRSRPVGLPARLSFQYLREMIQRNVSSTLTEADRPGMLLARYAATPIALFHFEAAGGQIRGVRLTMHDPHQFGTQTCQTVTRTQDAQRFSDREPARCH